MLTFDGGGANARFDVDLKLADDADGMLPRSSDSLTLY